MSDARRLLARARAAGVTVTTDGADLLLDGNRQAIAALLPELKAHKTALLALLDDPPLPAETREADTRRLWRTVDGDGATWSVSYCPPASLATVLVLWPDAQAIEPEGES